MSESAEVSSEEKVVPEDEGDQDNGPEGQEDETEGQRFNTI
jgi:hypothetical protein